MESPAGLQVILTELDRSYRYDNQMQGPVRCEECVEKFQRPPGETLNGYGVRERDSRERLKDAGILSPDEESAWVVLSRPGIPHYQEPNVRALCGGKLSPEKVVKALKESYGGDYRPEKRDVSRAHGRAHRATAEARFEGHVDRDDEIGQDVMWKTTSARTTTTSVRTSARPTRRKRKPEHRGRTRDAR